VAEISIRDQIRTLVSLQAVDTQIHRLKKEREEQPRIIKELEAKFEEKKARSKELEDNLKALTVRRKERELSLAAKEEEIKKNQTQLYQLKTNKEYQAKLKEIEGLNADKSVLEEEILRVLVDLDSLKEQSDKEKSHLKEEEGVFLSEKNRIENHIKELDAQLADAEGKRKQILPELDKKILGNYERVLKNREGLALVAVKDYACQGCFINVPAQVVNEIKMHDRIVVCEKCSRILYLEEDI
jgi:predicted  nucleic acid-binding Zn-ribbon protein